jgi:hypothetical protein
MMLADLRAGQLGIITFSLVRTGTILAGCLTVIDPFHFETGVKVIPSPCLVGMDTAPSGDVPTNDWDGFGLMFDGFRQASKVPLVTENCK